jgi:outer membrane protein TolC
VKRLMLILTIATVLLMLIPELLLAQSNLSLEQYLNQVKNKNLGYKGAVEKAQGAESRSREADLLTSPYFFANGQWVNSELQTTNVNATGSSTQARQFSLGLTQNTTIGLQAKLYYNLNYTDITGGNPAFIPMSTYYEGKPTLELTQSLWRNGFGSETRATKDALEAQARSTQYTESFTSKALLAEAESAYWRLSMAREFLSLQGESYDRGVKLRDWSKRRSQMQLADRSDLLQAEAGLYLRELDRQGAFEEERNATRQFNSLRGVDSDQAPEKLNLLSVDSLKELPLTETRDDVKAFEEGMKAAEAAARLGKEKGRPTLEVFAQLAKNAMNLEQSEATSRSLSENHAATVVGVRFNVPLDLGAASGTRNGYEQEVRAAQMKLERKQFEAEKDKRELKFKFNETKKRFKMAQAFEKAQKDKYFYEKDRHGRGRTTTFMVLQFEQELALAQLNRLRVQTELLGLVSQMKLHGGAQ